MELDLQSLFGLMCTAVLIGWDPATSPPPHPSPRIWAHIRGRYWSAKIDDISLKHLALRVKSPAGQLLQAHANEGRTDHYPPEKKN